MLSAPWKSAGDWYEVMTVVQKKFFMKKIVCLITY